MQNNVPDGDAMESCTFESGSEELDGVQGVYPNVDKKIYSSCLSTL